MVLGLSFYPLEQAPKHGDLCNEQIRDSNERFNLVRGGSWPPSQGTNADRCCQKIHLLTSGGSATSVTLPSFWKILFYFSRWVQCIIKPSFSGVVCRVDKRHKSMAKRRAA